MRCQDKTRWFFFALGILPVIILVVGCAFKNGKPVAMSTETNGIPSAMTVASTVTGMGSPTLTPLPTTISTFAPISIVLPAVTMSPQEAENALQELLRTNGNCTGKCLAGIRPDEMTVQGAIDQMAQWGMLRMSDKDKNGRIYIGNVYLDPNGKQANVNLVISVRQQTVDSISFQIPRFEDGEFLGTDIWLANREAWEAFQFGNLLKAYGTPSFVGFFFETRGVEGEFIGYTLEIQYEQLNLKIGIGGLAHMDMQDVFICPSKDPHSLGIDINPQRPLKEIQQFSPITWQALTGSDLQTFYHTFTNESNSDGCVITTLSKIIELDPYFR